MHSNFKINISTTFLRQNHSKEQRKNIKEDIARGKRESDDPCTLLLRRISEAEITGQGGVKTWDVQKDDI